MIILEPQTDSPASSIYQGHQAMTVIVCIKLKLLQEAYTEKVVLDSRGKQMTGIINWI